MKTAQDLGKTYHRPQVRDYGHIKEITRTGETGGMRDEGRTDARRS
jgi:hypothetical protein